MSNNDQLSVSATTLRAQLDSNSVSLLLLESRFAAYSDQVKNELVEFLAMRDQPLPQGKLIGRLHFIATAHNIEHMKRVYVANLKSLFPEARTASLYGLQQLGDEHLEDFAIGSLEDESNEVTMAACSILASASKKIVTVRRQLELLYKKREFDPRFHGTIELLKAHGIPTGN